MHNFNELLSQAQIDYKCDPNKSKLSRAALFNKEMRYENAIVELQGIAKAISYDNILENNEIIMLADWLNNHEDFIELWPISTIYGQFSKLNLNNSSIDDSWRKETLKTLKDITAGNDVSNNIFNRIDSYDFKNKIVVITGELKSGEERSYIAKQISGFGAIVKDTVTKATNLLIVGEKGSDAWRFGQYGRKIEKAVQLREDTTQPFIISETMYYDLVNKSDSTNNAIPCPKCNCSIPLNTILNGNLTCQNCSTCFEISYE